MSDVHSKEFVDVPPSIQRRLLRFVNAARIPEDLLRPPQRTRDTVDPHELMHDPGAHAPDIGHEHGESHEHARAQHREAPPDDRWARIKLSRRDAIEIIRRRPPLGYVQLRQIVEIDARAIGRWLEVIIALLSGRWYGAWSEPIPIEAGSVTYSIMNAAMLRTGKVLLIPSSTDTVLWDPATSAFNVRTGAVTGLTADLFCSGHSFLSDGRLLVVGGGGGSPGQPSSIEGWKFDPIAETWSKTASNMAHQRWYPTTVTLGDDPARVLVISGWMGSSFPPASAPHMEIYSDQTDTFSLVTTTGPVGEKIAPQTYPGMHLLPGGEVFYAPVGFGDCGQDANPDSNTEESGFFTLSGPLAGSWTNTGANIRTKGMSVLLLQPTDPFVQVLVVGGGTSTQSGKARLINLSSMTPTWGPEFTLLFPRIHPNVVLLPDGKVFICGGMEDTGSGGGACELYDPVASTIVEMDEVAYPRHYHSVALLLPSGQVMVAGGADFGGCTLSMYNTIEVYSPPYLFMDARPAIAGLPASVGYGKNFKIETPDADTIAKVVLVRPMAVTHQTDSEQRVVALEFHQSSHDKLTAKMPKKKLPHGLAPCGYYMLFILNADGVPSEAKFILLC